MNWSRTVPCLLLILMNAALPSVAQQVIILNQASGEPIENVALFNEDRTISTLTDRFGKADIQEFKEADSIYLHGMN